MQALFVIFWLLLTLTALGALGLTLLYIYESSNRPEPRLPAPRPLPLAIVLAFAGAFASALLCALLRTLNPLLRTPKDRGDALDGKLPVIFIHGLYDKKSAWLYLASKCAAEGRRVRCFGYASRGATPQSVTRAFEQFIRALEADFAGLRPVLAGHSLGGLLIRNWLRDPANRERISGVITFGTPHGGSACAHLAPGMLAAAITPEAAFIRELAVAAEAEAGTEAGAGLGAAAEADAGVDVGLEAGAAAPLAPGAFYPPRISLASPTDGAVLPASSLLPPKGWIFRPTGAFGHYTMLFAPSVWGIFCEELEKMDRAALKRNAVQTE